MKLLRFFHLHWLLDKRVLKQFLRGLLWVLLVIVVALGVCIAGVQVTGDIEQWESWLTKYAPVFLLWRLALYAGLIYGWLWMRKRVIAREQGQVKRRLLVSEFCALAVLIVMEVTNWLAHG